MPDPQKPTVAPFPFDQDSADIIFRTADHVHYHVHSIILSQASPVFRDMFSLPQPEKTAPSKTPSSDESAKPIVDITEHSATLYMLLIIIYPVPKPLPAALPLIEASLVAAQKYDLELPIQALKSDLRAPSNLSGHNALHSWAIGCRLRLEDVAQYAAGCLTFFGFDQLGDLADTVLRGVSAGDYFRLRSFCRRKLTLSSIYDTGTAFKFAEPSKATNIPVPGGATDGTTDSAFRAVPYPDVLVRSSNGIEAPAHRCVLAMTSPVLRDKLASSLPAANARTMYVFGKSQPAPSSLPVLQLDEPSDILWPLLDICCYPHLHHSEQHAAHKSLSLIMLARITATAEKYQMTDGLRELRARWQAQARSNAFDAYLAAAEVGQSVLAKDATRLVLNLPRTVCTQYSVELENAPALAYHRLLVYYIKCHGALKTQLDTVKAQFPDKNLAPVATGSKGERQWSLPSFLNKVGDATNGADGIISAARLLLPEYIQWRGTGPSLSSESRQEANNLRSVSQSLPKRLENAIQKVELKL